MRSEVGEVEQVGHAAILCRVVALTRPRDACRSTSGNASRRRLSACSSSCTSCRCRRGRGRCGRRAGRGCGSARAWHRRRLPALVCCWLRWNSSVAPGASACVAPVSTQVEPTKSSLSCSILKIRLGRLVADRAPHLLEQLHAFALVLDLRIDLGIADQADAAAQLVHDQQVVLPGRIDDLQEQHPLHPPHLGPVAVLDGREQPLLQLLAVELADLVAGELVVERSGRATARANRAGRSARPTAARRAARLRLAEQLVEPLAAPRRWPSRPSAAPRGCARRARRESRRAACSSGLDVEIGVEPLAGPGDQPLAVEPGLLALRRCV